MQDESVLSVVLAYCVVLSDLPVIAMKVIESCVRNGMPGAGYFTGHGDFFARVSNQSSPFKMLRTRLLKECIRVCLYASRNILLHVLLFCFHMRISKYRFKSEALLCRFERFCEAFSVPSTGDQYERWPYASDRTLFASITLIVRRTLLLLRLAVKVVRRDTV